MVAIETRRHPGRRAFFHPFPSVRAAGRPGRGARLDAGPPARHELPAGGDLERLVRNGRRPDVPHAGALAADSGCPRYGGPGEANGRNGAGVTSRRSGASVAARLSRLIIVIFVLSGIAASAPALDFTAEEERRILRHGPWPPVSRPDPSNRGFRQTGRHRIRSGAVLRSAPVVLRRGLLRNLPPTGPGLDRRLAA